MVVILMFAALVQDTPSPIKTDEVVVFYPTYATIRDDRLVTARLHGAVLEPEADSIRRNALVSILRRSLQWERGSETSRLFESRIRPFLADGERGKFVTADLQGVRLRAGPTNPSGQFELVHELDESASTEILRAGRPGPWLDVKAVLPDGDRRVFRGHMQLVAPDGLSVISDIDDTIKVTGVSDRAETLANTFVRPFSAVPGMAELYQKAGRDEVAFHYVSNSPWPLFEALSGFLEDNQFPRGTMHLGTISLSQIVAGELTDDKRARIDRILDDFPRRRFILIGDSAQEDPEIYGDVARARREQVARILIRDIEARPLDAARRSQALRDLDTDRIQVFDDPRSVRWR